MLNVVVRGANPSFASHTDIAETTLECRYDTGITLSWLLHTT